MKKLLAISFALLFLVSSAGATLTMHYCMGKLADWSVGSQETKICGGCGMEKSQEQDNGCCSDEQQLLKNSSDQKAIDLGYEFLKNQSDCATSLYPALSSAAIIGIAHKVPLSHAPPRQGQIASFILFRSILI